MSDLRDTGSSNDSAVGEAAEKYRDVAELGRGGMGEVVLSIASASITGGGGVGGGGGFDKLLVRKRLHASLADDKDLLRMFLREARLSVRLNHPNVVQTYDVGRDSGGYFIAMEYLEGQSLNSVIKRTSHSGVPFPLDMHVLVLAEACAGLHYAHELTDFDGTPLGIVHRDATPHNIFITYDGQVKVVDFGVAKFENSDTHSGFLKGKLKYMPPEQVGSHPIDRRADVFTIGVCLWEAVAGRRMWAGVPDLAILQALERGAIPSLRAAKPDCPESLARIAARALAAKPDERHESMAELQTELEAYLRESVDPTALWGSVTSRDAGRYVASLFGDTRVRIRAILDAELKRVREPPRPSAVLPSAKPPKMVSLAPEGPDETPSQDVRDPERADAGTAPSIASVSTAQPLARKRSWPIAAAIVVVAAMIVAFAIYRFLGASPTAPPPNPTSVGATSAPAR